MPNHCCVPECTKKGYRKDDGTKVYLDPGERGENISYWRSKTDNNTESAYGEDELLTKKGRARSLRPLDEFFMVMCRLRQGLLEHHLGQLFDISASTVGRIFIT